MGTQRYFWQAPGILVGTWLLLSHPAFLLLATWRFGGHPVCHLVGTEHLFWSARDVLEATVHP